MIPKAAQICREKGVTPFVTTVLGTTIGHLIDCGLNDMEVLTVVEDLLKMRELINNPAMRALLEKQFNMTKEALEHGDR